MEAMRYTKNFVPWKHNLAKPLCGATVANCMLKDFNHMLFRGASYDTRPPYYSTCFLWDSLDARCHYANTFPFSPFLLYICEEQSFANPFFRSVCFLLARRIETGRFQCVVVDI